MRFLGFIVILGLAGSVQAATSAQCPVVGLNIGTGTPVCGTGQYYDAATGLCCFTNTVGGGSAQGTGTAPKYCEMGILVNGMTICPQTHPLDPATGECCGSTPINGNAGGGRGNRGGTNGGATGACQDQSISGRPNDCQANANLCNNTLYYDLMTQQCPVTCNRCSQLQQNSNGGIPGCKDGVNASGVSECPENKFKCEMPLWKAFMEKECPATCGRCNNGTNNNVQPVIPPVVANVSSTTFASTTTANAG
ncbi:unnamed protein product [Bursaphelenchus xylophilus]|uniref:(pine wood nematode) hypothetical protein n=1 Tax=Bursaphelenchus xylophilus TaxID=6326 RepID=A0A1I7SA17_BURXY|nr:unnamed protein product [Bursaphelenchus xylophilus]CAG9126049.1 unnamed protein product [Bursaphelenchus xylophilus]